MVVTPGGMLYYTYIYFVTFSRMALSLDTSPVFKKEPMAAMVASTIALGDQLASGLQAAQKVKISGTSITNIVFQGMGGSALGAHIVKSVYRDVLTVPFEIVSDYNLPKSAGKGTLYFASSYSGTTEETVSAIAQAKKRGCTVVILTAGGALGAMIKKGTAGVLFDPKFNPSQQPRMGLGYALGGLIGVLASAGLLKNADKDLTKEIEALKKYHRSFGIDAPTAKNAAKKMALFVETKAPVVIAAEHVAGSAHTFNNQLNESAKAFSTYFLIPELNHHLLEGLTYPKANQKSLAFVCLESKLYHPRNQKRFVVTRTVLKKQKLNALSQQLTAATPLGQAIEMLAFGTYVSLYLAALHGVHPSRIPWVDFFKKSLGTAQA